MTPGMIHESPLKSGSDLPKEVLELIRPKERVNFAHCLLPILKDDSLSTFDKVDALMNLPGVMGQFKGLRVYDQVFHARRGPNKVQTGKLWELLCKELMRRLLSGDVDMALGPHLDAAAQAEVSRRRRVQREFLDDWLKETTGPPKSAEWTFDNRDGYREDFQACVDDLAERFRARCDGVYAALAEKPGGAELLAVPCEEVLKEACLTQEAAHPILAWLDAADSVEAFHSLRAVQAFGVKGENDDMEALFRFMDLMANNPDFSTPQAFWQNVYKLWLSCYGHLANAEFQKRMKKVVESFNKDEAAHGFEVGYRPCEARSYEELKAREADLGAPGHADYKQRVVASKVLDVVRCSMCASGPEAALALLRTLKSAAYIEDRFEVVRVRSSLHADAESPDGLRELVVNGIFNLGSRNVGPGGSRELDFRVVGAIRIILPEFLALEKGMSTLQAIQGGDFEPAPVADFVTGKEEDEME